MENNNKSDVIGNTLFNLLAYSSSSVSSSDNSISESSSFCSISSIDLNSLMLIVTDFIKNEQEQHQRQQHYVEHVIPRYSEQDFKSHFRLQRKTVEYLIIEYTRYKDEIAVNSPPLRGRAQLPPNLCIYVSLWYLGNQEPFRTVSDKFDISISSVYSIICEVTNWLCKISAQHIHWPRANNEKIRTANEFSEKSKFNNIIGCIDGSHIRIRTPMQNRIDYFNRKRFYSIILQGVVDKKKIH